MELGPGSQARRVHEVAVDPDVYEWYEYQDWDDWEEDEEQLPVSAAMKGGDRCRQCGKAGHFAKNCSTDMSKVRCFKCGDSGHKCELQEIAECERQAESQDLPEVQGES